VGISCNLGSRLDSENVPPSNPETTIRSAARNIVLRRCGALNPLCGTARPKPGLTTLAPNPVALSQVQQGLLLTVNGSHFYLNSIIQWNGAALSTTVISSTQLRTTINTSQISSPGTAKIAVHTPANPAEDLGCDSGGYSKSLIVTIT
jgi:hypothetical protein